MSMAALGLQWQSCKVATKSYDPQTLKKSPFGPLSLQTPDLNIYCILQSKTHSKLIQKAVKKKKKIQTGRGFREDRAAGSTRNLSPHLDMDLSRRAVLFVFDPGVLGPLPGKLGGL